MAPMMPISAWKAGKTGYPLVDAGMRELNATGFMHNRVRMVVALPFCKHLLLIGGWASGILPRSCSTLSCQQHGRLAMGFGSGCDAAPYFRVFNPTSQLEKFDKQLAYVRKWVPSTARPVTQPPSSSNRRVSGPSTPTGLATG